jgi:hypothetical protein
MLVQVGTHYYPETMWKIYVVLFLILYILT